MRNCADSKDVGCLLTILFAMLLVAAGWTFGVSFSLSALYSCSDSRQAKKEQLGIREHYTGT